MHAQCDSGCRGRNSSPSWSRPQVGLWQRHDSACGVRSMWLWGLRTVSRCLYQVFGNIFWGAEPTHRADEAQSRGTAQRTDSDLTTRPSTPESARNHGRLKVYLELSANMAEQREPTPEQKGRPPHRRRATLAANKDEYSFPKHVLHRFHVVDHQLSADLQVQEHAGYSRQKTCTLL